MRRLLIALGVLAAVLLPGAPAWAHNALAEATPAAGAAVPAGPPKVSLRFLQRLNPEFTTIVVSDDAKRRVPTSEPVIDGATGTVTFDEAPANGGYTVGYRVVSVDGHAVQGSYRFTVADPAKPAAVPTAAASSAVPAAVTASSTSGAIGGPTLIGLAGVGVVLAGFAGTRWLRWRREHRR